MNFCHDPVCKSNERIWGRNPTFRNPIIRHYLLWSCHLLGCVMCSASVLTPLLTSSLHFALKGYSLLNQLELSSLEEL